MRADRAYFEEQHAKATAEAEATHRTRLGIKQQMQHIFPHTKDFEAKIRQRHREWWQNEELPRMHITWKQRVVHTLRRARDKRIADLRAQEEKEELERERRREAEAAAMARRREEEDRM